MARGYTENVSLVDNVSASGVVTRLHFEGETITVQHTYDAAPHLEHARRMREAQDGKPWGDGKYIGHITPVELARFLAIKDPQERQAAMHQWLRDNPAFVGYTRWLRR